MDVLTGVTYTLAKRRDGGAKRWDVSATAAGACGNRFDAETDRVDTGTRAVDEGAVDVSAGSEGGGPETEGADAVTKERRRPPSGLEGGAPAWP
jgi:hypothetical protein